MKTLLNQPCLETNWVLKELEHITDELKEISEDDVENLLFARQFFPYRNTERWGDLSKDDQFIFLKLKKYSIKEKGKERTLIDALKTILFNQKNLFFTDIELDIINGFVSNFYN